MANENKNKDNTATTTEEKEPTVDLRNQAGTGKKVSLLAKLDMLAMVRLAFIGLTVDKATDGSRIAILQLDAPYPYIRGSQEIEYDGKKVALTQADFTEIKIHEDDIEEAGEDFQFDTESDTGSYSGSKLVLDVAKSGDVWLRKNTFKSDAGAFRAKNRNDRMANLVKNLSGNKPA